MNVVFLELQVEASSRRIDIFINLTNGTLSQNLITYPETLPKYSWQCPKMDWTSGLVPSLEKWSWLGSKALSL